jgi:hypothetical protein
MQCLLILAISKYKATMTSCIFWIVFNDFPFKYDLPYISGAYHAIRVHHLSGSMRQ